MAGIALKDRVDLISIMVPLEVIAKERKYIHINIILEWAFGYSIIGYSIIMVQDTRYFKVSIHFYFYLSIKLFI